MAKFKFDKPDRFDAVRAEKGVNHTIYGANGHNYGTFKTSLVDENTKLYRLAAERFQREHGDDTEATSETAGVYLFVMMSLHDWSGITSGGKPVPFSKEAAYEYLKDGVLEDQWLFTELLARSRDVANYQKVGDPRATKDEAAGK